MTDRLRERLFLIAVSTITLGSAVLSAMFGWSLSNYTIVAAILAAVGAAVCVIWSVIPIAVRHFWDERKYVSLGMAACLGILAATFDITSNFGSISWQRGENIQTAQVQNTRYEDTRESVREAKVRLASFGRHLDDLKSRAGWVGTRTPESFDGEIQDAKATWELEASPGRGGCGPKCDAARARYGSLVMQKGLAEQYVKLQKQIDATKRILSEARTESKATPKGESGALMQTAALASVWTLSLDPDERAIGWTERGIGWLIALFLCIAPALANYVWRYGISTNPISPNTNPTAARADAATLDNPMLNAASAPAVGLIPGPDRRSGNAYNINVANEAELWKVLRQLKSVGQPA